ncbi:MAG: TetR/AcrR family transcriptional regulator [Myxococcales bacterium]|nr:TetR/AcrR family transcriptional regulator [Myxococcales bacterium]MCB9582295.1 TetR/AcrR family transcriptional regulator [Polyangiaceae bacterium]
MRERIVSAAHQLLRENGVRAVVQVRVAEAAGVPQGHLTYYFPKKSDLLVAVAQRFREDTVRSVAKLLESLEPDLRTRLLAVVELMAADRTRTRALLGLTIEADAHPELRAELEEGAARVRRFLTAILGKSQPDADVDVVLALFWGFGVERLVLGETQTEEQGREALARVGEVLARHFGWETASS